MRIPSRAFVAPLILSLFLFGCGDEPDEPVTPDAPTAGWRADDAFVRAVNLGVHKMDRYEYAAAEKAFRDALELSPTSIEARVGLALATFNNTENPDNLKQGAELLEGVLSEEPDNLQALYFRGILYLDSGEPEKAVEKLKRVTLLVPHDAHAWYALARAKKHAGESPEAELRRAIKENPMLSSAYYDLSQTLRRQGPEKREEAKRLQEIFESLNDHPLADKMNMPMYRQMGELAIVRPLSARPEAFGGGAELSFAKPRTLITGKAGGGTWREAVAESVATAGALDDDGDLDLVTTLRDENGARRLALLRNDGPDGLQDVTESVGLAGVSAPVSIALGDYDNDGRPDLFVAGSEGNRLFHASDDGTYADVTDTVGTDRPAGVATRMAVFLDADHDADLDLYTCNAGTGGPAANQLLRNNSDGTFTDIAAEVGVACADARSVMLAPIDLDDDRDTDLIVFQEDAPIAFLRNELHEGFQRFDPIGEPVTGSSGGVAQDFDGDGLPDLLVFGVETPGAAEFRDTDGDGLPDERASDDATRPPRLFFGSAVGPMRRSEQFDECASLLPTQLRAGQARITDLDLDGDLDIVLFEAGPGDPTAPTPPQGLINDGRGLFAAREVKLPELEITPPPRFEVLDFTGDGVSDLLVVHDGIPGKIELLAGSLTPPPSWLGLTITGQHSQAHSTRSPVSGFGTRVEVRAGLHGQTLTHTGLHGGRSQSIRPLIFGLDGAAEADYVAVRWPDAITQSETGLEANSVHVLAEMQRRPTSCPMLFAWDGERFEFVGDFAGVGGLGYYAGPGEPPPPQVKELVRLTSNQLVSRDGLLQLRAAEPMEEAGYLDRLELLAIDHPAGHEVFPDDRLVVTGPPPTQKLLHVGERFFPVRGQGPFGEIEPENLHELDRHYAYQPPLDHRFFGYCHDHELVIEFGEELERLEAGRPTYLFLGGSLEYPYSQTNYAAVQAGLAWTPPRVDRLTANGEWETIVPDIGAPGGMARTIAVELAGEILGGPLTLRLTTNLELYYDRLFIAQDLGDASLEIHTTPMARAELQRLGFPQEYSPDGKLPRIYTYDIIEASFGFRRLPGTYTRYGDVAELLGEFDDRYVVMATGDEVAIDFDANALPSLGEGRERTYVLVSHGYCKDMDIHSHGPGTVEPLPFGAMSGFPYPEDESYPETEAIRAYQEEYNTRVVR